MEPIIEFASAADADEIAHLSKKYIEQDLGWHYTPQRIRKLIRSRTKNVVLELGGKPAAGITLTGVELFEAQDLLVNFEVTPEAPVGHYDARIHLGENEFFLADVFEVRSSP